MLIVSLDHPDHLEAFQKAGAEAVIAGLQDYDSRSLLSLPLEELLELSQRASKLGLHFFVNLQRPLTQQKSREARKILQALKGKADGIYISDEGYLMTAQELDMIDHMIFQSETLITSALDASFYQDLGVQAVSLAHDLSLEEILSLLKQVDTQKTEILVHGHFSWMESARNLLSSYFSRLDAGKPDQEKNYSIQEKSRLYALKIVEDEQGTVVYSPEPKNSYLQIPLFKESGLERYRIDGLFLGEEDLLQQIRIYSALLKKNHLDPAFLQGTDAVYRQKIGLLKEKNENIR